MSKLIIKSRETGLTPLQKEILSKIADGTIDRFYDASIAATLGLKGNLVNRWVPRGSTELKEIASQNIFARFPYYQKTEKAAFINFQRQDRALNFHFPQGFSGRIFLSSLDGFLNLPVVIPNGMSVRASGTSRGIEWNWTDNWQSPLLAIIFVKEDKWNPLEEEEKKDLEQLLRDWHISKGGKDDAFSSLTSLSRRFLGGNSFYRWALDFNQKINTSNVRDLSLAFAFNYNIRYIPWLNTSIVTRFDSVFNRVSTLEALPPLDVSRASTMSAFIIQSNIRSIPPLNTERVNTFSYAFFGNTQLKSFPLINTTAANFFFFSWNGCQLSERSVDNILISIAAGFAANVRKILSQSGGFQVLTGGLNSVPGNTTRSWEALADQTLTLTDGVNWTSSQDNKLVFSASHRLAMGREVYVESASQASLVGRKFFVCWVSLTEIRLAETLEKALRNECIEISNAPTGGKLYEVYEFNLNVLPWTALKDQYPDGLSGQEAKNYLATTFGAEIQTK